CQYFWNAYGEERGNKILNGEEDSPGPPNNWQDNSECNTEPSGSNFSNNQDDMQSSITGDSRTSKTKKRKLEHSKIDTYLAKPLNKVERLKFNNHLLLMTITNGEYGVTVAFDGWTNVVNQCLIGSVLVTNNSELLIWDVVDVSGHRERTKEIMEYTKKIFNDIKKDQIVVIALVTDSTAAYAASR
ncbi:16465_t:CDS:2, partial [Gigaspora rosea]